jgi:DNA-binding MarR family transcriptional regulator
METTPESVMERLQRVINMILFLGKKRVFRFKSVDFFPSEVHLMMVIREGTSTNATRMAEELAVTKGAVSQSLTRLEKKGVLLKTKDPSRKNELTLSFTPFGTRALEHHQRHTAGLFAGPRSYLNRLSVKERRAIQGFLAELEGAFDEVPE